jgi:two-component system NtrC family sensor kinase
VHLNQLVEQLVALSEQRAHLRTIEMRMTLDAELPTVNVSPSEVQQVLLNVINNALDSMEKTGGTIEITTRIQGHYAVKDVADTGPGIASTNLGRIFEPFFNAKPVGRGTGLGLSICYGIMKKMKGDITVNSEEGKGTTFHWFFPLGELPVVSESVS